MVKLVALSYHTSVLSLYLRGIKLALIFDQFNLLRFARRFLEFAFSWKRCFLVKTFELHSSFRCYWISPVTRRDSFFSHYNSAGLETRSHVKSTTNTVKYNKCEKRYFGLFDFYAVYSGVNYVINFIVDSLLFLKSHMTLKISSVVIMKPI